MMYQWKPDMIRFMRDASEYSNYNRDLAEVMLPYLTNESHVCDAGCGLGYLSLELARSVGRVTAVDMNPEPLKVLRENCSLRGINNIDVVRGDVFSPAFEGKYSSMVFCYFGDIEIIIKNGKHLCAGPLFIFKRNYETHRFSAGSYTFEYSGYAGDCRRLDEMGVRYKTVELETEFGQPFRSMDDARLFFELYSHDADKTSITDTLLHDRLTFTGREDFPLYMPCLKKSGCIIINPQDIPAEI